MRGNELRAHVDGFEIDRDRPAPVVQTVFQYGLGRRVDRRVVHQDVDLSEFPQHVCDRFAIGVVVGDVERVGLSRTACGGDFRGHLADRIRVSFDQGDLRPLARHFQGDRATEALAGAADNANLVRQQTQNYLPMPRYSRQSALASLPAEEDGIRPATPSPRTRVFRYSGPCSSLSENIRLTRKHRSRASQPAGERLAFGSRRA